MIKWTSASTDGHIDRGTLTFTVAEACSHPTDAPTATASAPTTAEPSDASAHPDCRDCPSHARGLARPDGDDVAPAAASSTDVLIPIILALVAVAVVGAYVLRRSRRA